MPHSMTYTMNSLLQHGLHNSVSHSINYCLSQSTNYTMNSASQCEPHNEQCARSIHYATNIVLHSMNYTTNSNPHSKNCIINNVSHCVSTVCLTGNSVSQCEQHNKQQFSQHELHNQQRVSPCSEVWRCLDGQVAARSSWQHWHCRLGQR